MTALPAKSSYTDAALQKEAVRLASSQIYDYLVGLFGSDGAAATALATLGATLSAAPLAKSASYTTVQADRGRLIDCTGTWTLSLHAAATAGAGYALAVRNSGSGTITIDPNSTETIDGATTVTVLAGESTLLVCTGSAWLTVGKTNTPVPTTGVLVGIDYVTTTGSYSKTAPAGATRALVKVQGGGGNGFSSATGGSGGYAEKFITGLTGGSSSISGVVGANGAASTITAPVTVTCAAGGNSASVGGAASGGDLNISGRTGWYPIYEPAGTPSFMGDLLIGYGWGGTNSGGPSTAGGQGIVIIEWYK